MHETSIARRLLEQIKSICAENDVKGAVTVQLEVGVMSGIEAELLKTAFTRLVCDTSLHGSTLDITTVPLTAACDQCETTIEVRDFDFRCPQCRQPLNVQTGEELRLISLTTTEPITP